MKKYSIIIFAAAVAFAVASCTDVLNNEEAEIDQIEGVDAADVTIVINASLKDNETKTYITSDGSAYNAYWNKGDVLSVVFDEGYGSRKKFTNDANDGEEGSFTGNVALSEGEHTLTGFYPDSYTVNRNGAEFEITIPSTQTIPSLSTFDKSADFLAAKPVGITTDGTNVTSVDMQFRRVGCILKVILEDNTSEKLLDGLKVSSITITSASDIISGRSVKCYIDGSSDDELVESKGSKSLTINYAGSDFEINGSNAAYAIVAPNKLSKDVQLTVDVITDDNKVTIHKVVTPASDIVLNASKVKPLRIKLNDTDVTVDDRSVDLDVTSVEIAKEGGTLSVVGAYTLINCTDGDVVTSCDGAVITAVTGVSSGTVNYTASVNDGLARHGWIGLKVGSSAVQKIDVFQLGNGFLWDFNDSDWADAFAGIASSGTEADFDLSIDKLSLKGNSAKWNTRNSMKYIQFKTSGSTDDSYVKFTAPSAGVLTVKASNTGGSNPARAVYVKIGDAEPVKSEGITGTTAVEKEFNITTPGAVVYAYPGDNPLCFYSVKFEYRSFDPEISADDPSAIVFDATNVVIDFTIANNVEGGAVSVIDITDGDGVFAAGEKVIAYDNDANPTSGTVTIPVTNNDTDAAKTATFKLRYTYAGGSSYADSRLITVTQNKEGAVLKQTYTWDFSSTEFSAANTGASTVLSTTATESSNISITWDYAGIDLTFVANKSTYNGTYIQTGGSGSSTSRCFSFDAPSAGTLTYYASSNGSSARALTVTHEGETVTATSGGSVSNTTSSAHVYSIDAAGEVMIYSADGQIRFYSIVFSNE